MNGRPTNTRQENTRGRPGWSLIIGMMLLSLPIPGRAIPVEERNQGVSLPLPAGFEETSATNDSANASLGQVFVLRGSNEATPPSWLSIRRLDHSHTGDAFQWQNDSNEFKTVNRYSERLGNLDMDVLIAEWTTNNIMFHQRSILFSTASDRFLLDLRSPSLQTNEMDAIMRRVIRTLAIKSSSPPPVEVQGWQNAVICLVMVAMVFVVALGKR